MPRVTIASKQIADDMSGVTLNFSDDAEITVNLDDLDEDIVRHLALHGLSQKLGDSYSGESDVAVARAKAQAVADRLSSGDWRATREGGAGGRITDLAHALAALTGKEISEAAAVIEGMEKEEKKALRAHPQIKVKLAEISAERAKAAAEKAGAGIDLTALMG